MPANRPHYLLFAEATSSAECDRQWRFVLQPIGVGERISADDIEAEVSGDRLELLAAVRGLEALDQPSRVTLLSRSKYVRRAISHDLGPWREAGFRWERFGRLVPIRDQDLWQRLDRALTIHEVACWPWPQDGQMPGKAAEGEFAAVTTYGITCAGAIGPCLEPTLVIIRRRQENANAKLRLPRIRAGRAMARLNPEQSNRRIASNRPELSRTA